MDLTKVAEREDTDTLQLFVRASRLFVKGPAHPSADHDRWLKGGALPSYMEEFLRYWSAFNRTETHNDRRH